MIDGQAEPAPPAAARSVPDPASAVGQTLARMRAVDRSFEPAAFLDGAEKAFRMIVAAFAAGDRATLRALLSEDTYRAFEQAIAAREAAGQTQVSTIHAIHSADDRGCGPARDGRLDHRALRLRPDQPDAGQGWPPSSEPMR